MQTLMRDLAQPVTPLSPDDRGELAYARFRADPDLLLLPVVLGERPVGLCTRQHFMLQMASDYGRALYAGRPVTFVMNTDPLVVEIDASLDTVSETILNDRPAALLDGVIVVEVGRYVGVASSLEMLRATATESHQRRTALEASNRELEAARNAADRASKAKSEFLSMMSHEIRTPLNAILVGTAVLEGGLTRVADREIARTVVRSGKMLNRLLSDVLDMARIEAGKLSIERAPFTLAELARDVDQLWRPMAEEKGLEFRVALDLPQGTPLNDFALIGDGFRIRQVVFNLASNAIKFTTSGRVVVGIRARSLTGSRHRLELSVTDTGPGIEPRLLARLFSPFEQGAAGRSASVEGSGLGLAITRSLVQAMGGDISVMVGPEGRGTRFCAELYLDRLDTGVLSSVEPTDAPPPALRILAVDDNLANRTVLSRVLGLLGHEVVLAEDGREAVELADQHPYDVVLMDVRMPVMDGVEATRRIRGGTGPNRLAPIIALTAETEPKRVEALLAVGMTGHLPKPLEPAALARVLAMLVPEKRARTAAAA
jgi:signal transduction histidine kinase/ActR/RegA family two-component response regulator